MFCRGFEGSGEPACWFLTLVVTRPLKLLYFDGSSAAKIANGTMDTQDILAFGKVEDQSWDSDLLRLDRLCEWGSDYGLDGFVR